MKLRSATGTFKPAPAGSHIGVCIKFVDLGTQVTEYKGEVKHKRIVMISWELANELMDDGRPFIVSQRYTWSMDPKSTLRKHLESWRGKAFSDDDLGENGFDVRKLLGVPCSMFVTHSENGQYANISAIGPMPKGMARPEPTNELVYFSLEPGSFALHVYDAMSQKMRETIAKSPEYLSATTGKPIVKQVVQHDDPNDEVPF
jgi:hypothetical protein